MPLFFDTSCYGGRMDIVEGEDGDHYLKCRNCGWESRHYDDLDRLKRKWKDYEIS